jgi:glutathione S-transferase
MLAARPPTSHHQARDSGAPNPTKVALFLEEGGIQYEALPVDTRRGEQHKPEFVAINPNAKLPAIVDGDVTVFDSNAILLYLAEKTGKFLPSKGDKARGERRDGVAQKWKAIELGLIATRRWRIRSGQRGHSSAEPHPHANCESVSAARALVQRGLRAASSTARPLSMSYVSDEDRGQAALLPAIEDFVGRWVAQDCAGCGPR